MITEKDLETYNKVVNELDELCRKYSEKYLREWQHYCGWKLVDTNIEITYCFEVYCDAYYGTNQEYESIEIPIEQFLEQCKELL